MAKKPLSIASFNLYNLQRPGFPMYRGKTYTQEEYDQKIAWTALMLRQLDADIIGFQELWHPQALEDAFTLAGLINDYELTAHDAGNQVYVALALRKDRCERKSVRWIKDFPEELRLIKRGPGATAINEPDYELSVNIDHFSREILRVRFTPPYAEKEEEDIIVFVGHLKSKLPMRLDKPEREIDEVRAHSTAIGSALSTIRRTAEAAALRIILNKLMKRNNLPVIVLGDLNDAPNSVTTSLITGDPRHRLFAKSRVGSRSDAGLYSAATLQEYRSLRDVYYTYLHNGQHESLDHILVSEQFYDYSQNHIWTFQELRVFNDHITGDVVGAGDHGVICAYFDHNPA